MIATLLALAALGLGGTLACTILSSGAVRRP